MPLHSVLLHVPLDLFIDIFLVVVQIPRKVSRFLLLKYFLISILQSPHVKNPSSNKTVIWRTISAFCYAHHFYIVTRLSYKSEKFVIYYIESRSRSCSVTERLFCFSWLFRRSGFVWYWNLRKKLQNPSLITAPTIQAEKGGKQKSMSLFFTLWVVPKTGKSGTCLCRILPNMAPRNHGKTPLCQKEGILAPNREFPCRKHRFSAPTRHGSCKNTVLPWTSSYDLLRKSVKAPHRD